MPGLKKSPGMADIDVCYGAHKAGAEGVMTAMQRARWTYEQARLREVGTLDPNRLSDIISSPEDPPDAEVLAKHELPKSEPLPSEEGVALDLHQLNDVASLSEYDRPQTEVPNDTQSPVSPLAREDSGDVVASPSRSLPLDSFDRDEARLPPTPPTMNNSDDAELNHEQDLDPAPLFANDVRSALSSKQSGQNMTPVNQPASPPTPDPSPPRTQQFTPTPAMEQIEKPQFLHPMVNHMPNERSVRDGASSRAESFRTAHEDQMLDSNTQMSPVHLPENDKLPQHWLDTTHELRSASMGLGDVTVQQTPKIGEIADPQRSASEKYPSGYQRRGLGIVSEHENVQSANQHAEDRNNAIYKRLREENVKRHSTVSANSGAITVGIAIPSPDLTPRTLRRQNKRSSLRVSSNPEGNREMGHATDRTVTSGEPVKERKSGVDGGRTLKIRKARQLDKSSALMESPLFGRSTLDDSPIFESNIRQVSSPARLGPDPSDMTALTFASMQDSPSANKRMSKFQQEPQHKLRHVSYEDRLSRNMSVRRTSLEASPPLDENAFTPVKARADIPIHQQPTSEIKVKKNIAVKRSNATQTKPPQRTVQPITPLPTVHTSPGASPNARSPSTLRHFSREERLENNASVRRTSLDLTPLSPPQTEPTAARGSFDKGTVTSSPTSLGRSMDARYLQPTTTPGSISQFSDRTDNIEIGEANGVRFYPHTNESLLVVQQGSRPTSNEKDASEAPNFFPPPPEGISQFAKPVFAARIEPPTPTLSTRRPNHQVDSPLTNPRTAPEPPILQVIPPTPEMELDRQLDIHPLESATTMIKAEPPRRLLSLVQRARRYSDIVFPNLGSLRISRDRRSPEERATHLSPTWKPQGFWDEFDSDNEFDDFEPAGILPRGGDTSNVGENEAQRKGLLPRAMSRRLPGFRGTGGFLQGNSLGIDRHGTNNRRHYVSTTTRTLSQRQSEEVIKNLSSTTGRMSPEQRMVKARRSPIPFGPKRFRAKMRAIRLAKEEREKEMRREKLRRSIGYRVYHDA